MEENEKNKWLKIFIPLLIIVIGFIVFVSMSGFGMMGSGMMGGMMGFGWLFMLLPIILIIALIYAILDRDTHKYSQPPYTREESPMEVLERRYANGEIGREEYFRMKKDMRM